MDYEKLFRLYKGFLKAEDNFSRDLLKSQLDEFIKNDKSVNDNLPIALKNLYIHILELYGEFHKHQPDIEKSELEEQIHLKVQEFKKMIEQMQSKEDEIIVK